MTTKPLRVLISGASIAGPAAAYFFARAGATVTVVERFPSLRANGQSIDIRTAGVTVMRRIPGMEQAVRAKNTQISGIRLVDTHGATIAHMAASGDVDAQSLVSEFEIFRGDLSRILYDASDAYDNVTYVFDEQIASITQPPPLTSDSDGTTGSLPLPPARVTFTNGNLPPADYDLVVAADGATSRTRAMGLACGVRDHVTRLNTWAAYFTTPVDYLNGSMMGHGYTAVPGKFVAAGPDPFSGKNTVVMMCIQPRDAVDRTKAFRDASKQGEAALKQYVASTFRGIGWRADEMVDGLLATDDFYASEMVQVKLPQLSKGRFVLIGDAGHATGPTGTGTSLAMTSAYVLAGEICRAQNDVAIGLRAFEERMRPIVKDMQVIPPGVPGVMAPQTAWGLWLRNVVIWTASQAMRFGAYFSWMGKYWASSFGGGDKYKLPEYEWVLPAKEVAVTAESTHAKE